MASSLELLSQQSASSSFLEGEPAARGKPEQDSRTTNVDGHTISTVTRSLSADQLRASSVESSVSTPSWSTRLASVASVVQLFSFSTDSTASSTETQNSLRQKKSLLSSADFATMAGRSFWGHGATYRSVKNALQDYEHAKAGGALSTEEEIGQLQNIQQKAQTYLEKKNRTLSKENASTLQDRRDAVRFLIRGIESELEKLTDKLTQETFGKETDISFRAEEEFFSISLSGGKMNSSVDKITYKDKTVAVFKAVDNKTAVDSTPAAQMGIPCNSTLAANLAGRNVASYKVSSLLGWSMVPRTGFATHHGQIGSCQVFVPGESVYKEEWQPMSVDNLNKNTNLASLFEQCINGTTSSQDLAILSYQLSCKPPLTKSENNEICEHGKPITLERAEQLLASGEITFARRVTVEVSKVDFKNPNLQKTLSRAHLFDLLTGQLDRNPGNFIYRHIPGPPEEWDASLIDNDLSFPQKFTNFDSDQPNTPLEFACSRSTFLVAKLPDLIDREAAEAIARLDPAALQKELEQCGLTDPEIQATLSRLELLKAHITSASDEGPVRLIDDWNETRFGTLMGTDKKGRYDNYVGLHLSLQQEQENIMKKTSQPDTADEVS